MFMHYVHTEDKPVRDAAELVASRRQAITGAGSASRRRPQHEQRNASVYGRQANPPDIVWRILPNAEKRKVELANHARFGYSFRECQI
jgi:hypothetical protein